MRVLERLVIGGVLAQLIDEAMKHREKWQVEDLFTEIA